MKIPLVIAIVGGAASWILSLMTGDYSLYFHIPFCTKKCDYCHFYVLPDKQIFKEKLFDGFKKEWQSFSGLINKKKLVSIYFGGGTPALMGPDYLKSILSWINPPSDIEITLEANPENISYDLISSYKKIGINRVSIGIQSLDEDQLKILGRSHSANKAIDAILLTHKAGIKNISVDLMYDLPDQTLASFQKTVDETLKLPIQHLSLYNLTFEPHTLFFKKQKLLNPRLPTPELSLQLLNYVIVQLENKGFTRYEISAFCKENKKSIHNSGYWQGRPFLGLGPSAFSYWEGKRFKNVSNLSKYLKKLNENLSPVDFEEQLNSEESKRELLAIHLRLVEGIYLEHFINHYGEIPQATKQILDQLMNQGYLISENKYLKLSEKGLLFYDFVATEII